MTMDYAKLKAEITTDPLGLGYAGMTDQQVADSLNALTRTLAVSKTVGALGIMREVGPTAGATILDKLEAASAQDSRLKWFLRELTTNGVDLGHPSTRQTIDELVAGGVLTVSEGAALKGAAETAESRATELGLGDDVSAQMVNVARTGSW